MNKILSRSAVATLLVAVSMLLAACGGGGGGGSTPSATPSTPATAPVAAVTCPDGSSQTAATTALANAACPAAVVTASLANGASAVSVNTNGIVFTSNSPLTAAAVTFKAGGITAVAGLTTTALPSAEIVTFTVTALPLNYGQSYTASLTATDSLGRSVTKTTTFTTVAVPPPTCTLPQVLNSTNDGCITPVLSYTDKVYAIWGLGSDVFAVTKAGVTQVVNKTQYQTGAYPIYSCGLGTPQLTTGQILVSCADAVSGTNHVFYVDPTDATNGIYDYAGTVPANVVFTSADAWDPAYPTWGSKAHVADGWYFTTNTVTWVLDFQSDATNAITTVKAGTFAGDGTVKVLRSYSN